MGLKTCETLYGRCKAGLTKSSPNSSHLTDPDPDPDPITLPLILLTTDGFRRNHFISICVLRRNQHIRRIFQHSPNRVLLHKYCQ